MCSQANLGRRYSTGANLCNAWQFFIDLHLLDLFFWSTSLSRIFISLSILPALLVFITMGVGWWIGDYNGVYAKVMERQPNQLAGGAPDAQVLEDLDRLAEPQRRFRTHFQLALATSLAVILINCLSVTYLIGTSRWIREVCDAYGLDSAFVVKSDQLKRRTFPWSMLGACAILIIVALGAASDPGTLRQTTASWVLPHSIAAMLGASVILIAIVVQAMNLQQNARIINEVVGEVRKEREARGLAVE